MIKRTAIKLAKGVYIPKLLPRSVNLKHLYCAHRSQAFLFENNRRFFSQSLQRSNDGAKEETKSATLKVDNPQYMIAFTCKKCETRSSHTFSKQSYNKGTVLIQCPGCKNRHLIADNLKIFKDSKFSLEEILKAKGQSLSTSTEDLIFEDIPESLRDTIGHHAKDAPEEYRKKTELDDTIRALPHSEASTKKE